MIASRPRRHFLAELADKESRARTCERKRGYPSRWGANEAIRSIGDYALVAYACRHCGLWHVGHAGGAATEASA